MHVAREALYHVMRHHERVPELYNVYGRGCHLSYSAAPIGSAAW